jgi:hypothetical protein
MYITKETHLNEKGENTMINTEFLKSNFGIELEMTGITRRKAEHRMDEFGR